LFFLFFSFAIDEKKHILSQEFMRKYFSFFAPQKYISIFLIFCLLVSQTIRVDFFDIARASPENYHDIVSVIVDKKTYGSLTSEIKRYATDIG